MASDQHNALTGTDLHINKPFAVVSKTTTYAILASDELIKVDTSGGAFTVTLPNATGLAGKEYIIKKMSSDLNTLTIATTSSQTIDGALTQGISTQYTSLTLISDGSNWIIV